MLKLALIGMPVKHSIGKNVYDDLFKILKITASYELYEIEEPNLNKYIEYFIEYNFKGFNVTIPYKTIIVNYLNRLEKEAAFIRSVNNVVIEDKMLIGFNTDLTGIKKTLELFSLNSFEYSCIIGAGGVAKAAIYALKDISSKLFVIVRNKERKIEILEIFADIKNKIEILEIENSEIPSIINRCDIIINCTPVGMFPNINSSPIPLDYLSKENIVMDLVYNPIETKFIKHAKKLGCVTIDGLWVFVFQLIENMKIWFDIDLDAYFVRNLSLKYLK